MMPLYYRVKYTLPPFIFLLQSPFCLPYVFSHPYYLIYVLQYVVQGLWRRWGQGTALKNCQ